MASSGTVSHSNTTNKLGATGVRVKEQYDNEAKQDSNSTSSVSDDASEFSDEEEETADGQNNHNAQDADNVSLDSDVKSSSFAIENHPVGKPRLTCRNVVAAVVRTICLLLFLIAVATNYWVEGVKVVQVDGDAARNVSFNYGLWMTCSDGECEPTYPDLSKGFMVLHFAMYAIVWLLYLAILKYRTNSFLIKRTSSLHTVFVFSWIIFLSCLGAIHHKPPEQKLSWSFALAVLVLFFTIINQYVFEQSRLTLIDHQSRLRAVTAAMSGPTDVVSRRNDI